MSAIEDYQILIKEGNIAFYKSCEVTQLFVHNKKDKTNINLFILAVFEEKPFEKTNHKYLGRPIPINDEFNLGIQRYWLSIAEAESCLNTLHDENNWDFNNDKTLKLSKVKSLSKQYIPATEGNPLNQILKNNFHNGSHILEFFDEDKTNLEFLLKLESLKIFNEISAEIKKNVPIDLSIIRDRIGNIVFQFPVTILESDSNALSTWDGIALSFTWHKMLLGIPDCLIQVESTLDQNYMGSKIDEYNKAPTQIVVSGNLDQKTKIKIWRKEPSLIISTFNGTYIRNFDLSMGIINSTPRIFEINGEQFLEEISNNDMSRKKVEKTEYTKYITNRVYDAEKQSLEKSLSFKQYRKSNLNNGINDLRVLIRQKDKNGVYLWDPFLTSDDILKTLYFSKTSGVPLKAIGAINRKVRDVYSENKKKQGSRLLKLINWIKKIRKKEAKIEHWREYLIQNKAILDNPKNNNVGLNIEFRIQHTSFGWAFHDRFLIFPGDKLNTPKVYSLGTSINSYGGNHHILQEVSHPQPVIDAFNELWEELNKPECIVWKFPK